MRFLLLAFLLAALTVPVTAQSQRSAPDPQKQQDDDLSTQARSGGDALNATFLGQLDERSSYGDVWGYVDPATGREYALLAVRYDGLSIIDLDGPSLQEVGFVDGLGSFFGVDDAKDIKTYGHYAYLAHEFNDILVIDLSDPTNPDDVAQIDARPGPGDDGSHNILIEGDYLYVVGGRSPGGLRIFDLGVSPTSPPLIGEIAGEFGNTYYHDLDIVGDLAYAAAIYDEGIDVLDLSDRTDPEVITTIIYPASYQGAHNVCATPDGQTIFVGDEIGSGPWTRAFDVSDLNDPEMISELIVDANRPVHNCYVEGDLLYVAHYTLGLQVFDVSNPANPDVVAFYDTYTGSSTGFSGAWTAYPYLPSGRIIISDLQGGLFMVRADVGIGLSASSVGSLNVAPGGSVDFDYTITNNDNAATSGDLFFTAKRNETVVAQGVIMSGTLPAGQSVSGTYTQQVPANAPAGVYTYELHVGRSPSIKTNTSAFPLTVVGSGVAGSEVDWSIADATPWTSTATPDPIVASKATPTATIEAYPNPFSEATTLRFSLDEAAPDVRLAVYDVLGREVAVLVDGELDAGMHEVVLDGRDLPNGAYAYRLNVAGTVQTGSLTLLR